VPVHRVDSAVERLIGLYRAAFFRRVDLGEKAAFEVTTMQRECSA
jgi:hypothetical protein